MNHTLIERLRFREAWLKDFLIYRHHTDITNKVSNQIYSEIPILSLLLKIYFLPTIMLRFMAKIREWHDYNKCLREIKILKEEIDKNEKNFVQKS